MISNLYYSQFEGETFVIQADAEAVENPAAASAILRGINDLLGHGIRVALVLGKTAEFEKELCATYGASRHPETQRLIIPETALPRIEQERARVIGLVEKGCRSGSVPCSVLPRSVVRAERRIGHGSTGIVTSIAAQAIRSVLDGRGLAIIPFGGEDDRSRFLHVPSTSLAADLAVEFRAQKLLFLMEADGIFLPDHRGDQRQLSFADLEGLLCLLQRKTPGGDLLLCGSVVTKVHATIRAIAGNVAQVHLVSHSRLLDEILTRTGVGTMVERQQSHLVDYARDDDLDEIQRLHDESQRYTSTYGTPYVKPLDWLRLERHLPQTLLLKHRGIIVGKLHGTEIPAAPEAFQIGGFVIAENHQDSQQGHLLLCEALARFREAGYARAAAITAAPRAKRLFERSGGRPVVHGPWQAPLLGGALPRYAAEERQEVRLFEFPLANRPSC